MEGPTEGRKLSLELVGFGTPILVLLMTSSACKRL